MEYKQHCVKKIPAKMKMDNRGMFWLAKILWMEESFRDGIIRVNSLLFYHNGKKQINTAHVFNYVRRPTRCLCSLYLTSANIKARQLRLQDEFIRECICMYHITKDIASLTWEFVNLKHVQWRSTLLPRNVKIAYYLLLP